MARRPRSDRLWMRFFFLAIGTLLVLSCNSMDINGPGREPRGPQNRALFSFSLSNYFPPSEASGGWRVASSASAIKSLGMDSAAVAAFGAYTMSLPYEGYYTGVTGYKASNK